MRFLVIAFFISFLGGAFWGIVTHKESAELDVLNESFVEGVEESLTNEKDIHIEANNEKIKKENLKNENKVNKENVKGVSDNLKDKYIYEEKEEDIDISNDSEEKSLGDENSKEIYVYDEEIENKEDEEIYEQDEQDEEDLEEESKKEEEQNDIEED